MRYILRVDDDDEVDLDSYDDDEIGDNIPINGKRGEGGPWPVK